jgi:hypothetical protein
VGSALPGVTGRADFTVLRRADYRRTPIAFRCTPCICSPSGIRWPTAWLRSGDLNRWPPGFSTARIAAKLSPILWYQMCWPVRPRGLHSHHRNASAPTAKPSLPTSHSTSDFRTGVGVVRSDKRGGFFRAPWSQLEQTFSVPLRKAELRMTQAMNLRMFFGVAWLLIGLAEGYWLLSRNQNARLRRSGTFLLLGSLALIFSFFCK